MLMFYLQLIETESDQKLFEQIYNNYRRQMVFAANNILHNPDLAEDAIHNAFIGIINNMQSVRNRGAGDIKNYVIRAAVNAAINISKEPEYKRNHIEFDEEEIGKDSVDDTVLEEICKKEVIETLVNAILALEEPYHTVLNYHFVMQMEYNEIAVVLHRKPNTVRQQLCRGKKKLYNSLKEGMFRDG